jgi:spore maturation protein SpmB
VLAVLFAKLFARFWPVGAPLLSDEAYQRDAEADKILAADHAILSPRRKLVAYGLVVLVLGSFVYAIMRDASLGHTLSEALQALLRDWLLLVIVMGFVLYGVVKGVRVYEALVEGAKEGFDVALRIIPYLTAIMVAIGMLRASGAIDAMVATLSPITNLIGMPAESLPMAFLRPLSGSGAYAVATEIMKTNGPDSLVGQIVSTMQGSTETTFYVLALYFGVVQIKRTRHAVLACLLADSAGLLMAVWMCRTFLS